ncbi:hypothetical protein HN592_04030 [Candidatus Woesearchaeota archaeon]|nr:hypothetical protein [Candidatus Woesearchaeota archaeon]
MKTKTLITLTILLLVSLLVFTSCKEKEDIERFSDQRTLEGIYDHVLDDVSAIGVDKKTVTDTNGVVWEQTGRVVVVNAASDAFTYMEFQDRANPSLKGHLADNDAANMQVLNLGRPGENYNNMVAASVGVTGSTPRAITTDSGGVLVVAPLRADQEELQALLDGEARASDSDEAALDNLEALFSGSDVDNSGPARSADSHVDAAAEDAVNARLNLESASAPQVTNTQPISQVNFQNDGTAGQINILFADGSSSGLIDLNPTGSPTTTLNTGRTPAAYQTVSLNGRDYVIQNSPDQIRIWEGTSPSDEGYLGSATNVKHTTGGFVGGLMRNFGWGDEEVDAGFTSAEEQARIAAANGPIPSSAFDNGPMAPLLPAESEGGLSSAPRDVQQVAQQDPTSRTRSSPPPVEYYDAGEAESFPGTYDLANNRVHFYGNAWHSTIPDNSEPYSTYHADLDMMTVQSAGHEVEGAYKVTSSKPGEHNFVEFSDSASDEEMGALRTAVTSVGETAQAYLGIALQGARTVLKGGSSTGSTAAGAPAVPAGPWGTQVADTGYRYAPVDGKPGIFEVKKDGALIGFTDQTGVNDIALFGDFDITKISGFYKTSDAAARAVAAKGRGETLGGDRAVDGDTSETGYELIKGRDGSATLINRDTGLVVRRRFLTVVSGGDVPGNQPVWRTEYFDEKGSNNNIQDGVLTHFTLDANGDGQPEARIEFGDVGYSCVDLVPEACKASTIERAFHKENWDHLMSAGQAGVAWSQLSSIFGMEDDFADWRFDVDKMFHDAFLGSEYWSEAICSASADVESGQDVMFSFNEEGLLTQAASIYATKQFIQTPEGNSWLYRVSFFLRNPSKPESSSIFGDSDSDSSGLVARDAGLDPDVLSGEEQDTWNIVKKAGREISNERSRYSRNARGDVDYEFNIQFRGQRTINLFTESDTMDSGDEISYAGDDSFAAYSSYNYNQVCITFPGEQPVDAFYEEVSEVCTTIVDVSSSAPTTVPVETEDRVEQTSNGDFRVI